MRPTMEYGFTVWDPYREYQKTTLEKVQWRAARFATNTCGREKGSVTRALDQSKWESGKRRKVARLTLLYRTLNGQSAVSVLDYVKFQSYLETRFSHPNKFIQLQP